MRQIVLPFALTIAALAATASPVAAQTTDHRLEAFKAACVPHRGDPFAATAALHASGWTLVKPGDSAVWDALLIKRDEILSAEIEQDENFSYESVETAWTRDGYILSLSRATSYIDWSGDDSLEDEEPWVFVGCNLYDFAATAPVPVEAMTAWTATLPVQTVSDTGMSGHTWNVYEMMRGTAEVQIAFIEPGGAYVDKVGFSGVAITMDTSPSGMKADPEETPADDAMGEDDWMNDMAPADDDWGD